MCHLPYFDGISALLSLLGFFVSLAYVQDTDVLVWENNMIFSTDPHLITASDGLSTALFDTCAIAGGHKANHTGPYTMFQQKQVWGNSSYAYTGLSIPVDTGRSYKPWLMLHWVLICSFLFQGARFLAYCEHDDAHEGILFQYVPTNGPDFWRWVEYALTSPLQIIIIAGSFYMREIVQLALIAGLQGALVLLGYVIELEIQTLCLEKIAAWQAGAYRMPGMTVKMFVCQCKLAFLFLCAYTSHAIIWVVLIAKFLMQAQAISDCRNPSKMPPVIIYIISLECLLFTLFGVVLTVQAVYVARKPSLDPLAAQSLWKKVSWWYSFLSISAKLVLEWGFITLLASTDAQQA